jgi:hypothetical protein
MHKVILCFSVRAIYFAAKIKIAFKKLKQDEILDIFWYNC